MFSNPIVHLTRKQISGLEDNERNKNVREVCDVFYKWYDKQADHVGI